MKKVLIDSRFILLLIAVFTITSCASNPSKLNPNYQEYLKTVSKYHPKLVEIKAQPGQTIELKGVEEFVVYAPSGSNVRIQPYRAPEDTNTVIAKEFFKTTRDITLGILPNYFGWKYGSSVLKKAFDKAGNHYNVQGNYNTGTYTTVGGDYTGADKYAIQGNYNTGTYAGGDYTSGDKTGQDKNTVTGDYTTGTKDANTVSGDYVTGTKTDTTETTTTEYLKNDNSTK